MLLFIFLQAFTRLFFGVLNMDGKFLHNCIKGVACLAMAFLVMANKPCFADDRLLIGSFNNEDRPVQLVVANPNSPMSSVLATAANQTVSAHPSDTSYAYLSGQTFLDYIGYCGLFDILNHSAQWFYDNSIFCNYSGFYNNGNVQLCFVFAKSNCVSQPLEWIEGSSSGLSFSVLDSNSFYLCPALGCGWFCFSPYNGFFLPNGQAAVNDSLPTIVTSNDSSSLQIYVNSPIFGRRSFPIVRDTFSSLSNINSLFDTFVNTDNYKYLYFSYSFSLSNFNNDVVPTFRYSFNYFNTFTLRFLATSFYTYSFNSSEYRILDRYDYYWRIQQFGKIVNDSYVYNTFPFIPNSGALAFESDFVVDPTPTPTPFPTFEPWDPNNPAGGTTPTPIPPWRDSELPTPTPYPSVSTAPIPTGIVTDFIPLLDLPSSENTLSNITGIIKEFNAIFSRKVFALGSYTLQLMYYFSGWFKFIFIVPAGVFVAFLIGRLRKK